MLYRVVVITHDDLYVEHCCELDRESADLLRDTLEENHPVVGVIPITQKRGHRRVPEI